ncbi:daunorubicin ABC transporter ATP-binding protein [Thermococcus profundus]|uniref:Daunorubicin ABC transporter ATP-binding protein n=1 Tax=Thermococcus profundus TaxID=49899 RepID=A0A2Z2MCL1_THEPR|nr:ABC transporter ATP-binding protein [Thermococcus profundus]ASJ02432.1 daunorubicin ABC transporter ATP-binding protein [Thermococcus profundus]
MRAIEIRGLKKSYGNFQALKGIDLEVEEGETFALLGPNGAGKTTLIRILAEGLAYDSGAVKVFGEPLSKKTARFIGYVPQESLAYDLLTVEENLGFYADLYNVPGERVGDLIGRLKLPPKKRAKELSGGFRRRLNLAVALLYEPKILILDEPSVGLDVPSRRELWDIIRGFRDEGKTVLLATHYMEEAEELADRVAIMNEGKVIAVGTPEELKRTAGSESVIHVEGILRGVQLLKKEFRAIEGENYIRVAVENAREVLPRLVEALVSAGSEIKSIRVEEPTLEDVFLKLTGRGLR